ncbi:MAG: sialidase family protein [Desulfovibrionaceae bacterium]
MPSLTTMPERHVVIDRREGHYLCFPDIAHSGDGALLCVYNEFDKHVGTRRRLMLKRSEDGGRTWDAPRMLCAQESHCPRITRLSDGMLIITDDAITGLYFSTDQGRTWAPQQNAGLAHGLIDHVLEFDTDVLFTTGHLHRGNRPQPKIRQAPTEQMGYLSPNRGRYWNPLSIIANEKCLVLCEASVIRLPGKTGGEKEPIRLLALMRENSSVGEPMYYCVSEDNGVTWSQPMPTPLVGHRPSLGWTQSGKLLVTYRDVGPAPGTKAWLGTLEELCSDFAVHGLHPTPGNPRWTPEGLLTTCSGGLDTAVRYGLRPITDPEFATASLEVEVHVREADQHGCGLYLGGIWWKLYPDGLAPRPITASTDETTPRVPYALGIPHTIRVDYVPGQCSLFVDGEHKGDFPAGRTNVNSRPILVGVADRLEDNRCDVLWRRMHLATHEPRLGRDYTWSWDHANGQIPDAWINAHVLELQNDRQAHLADFGYSGWVELTPKKRISRRNARGSRIAKNNQFLCVYHHGDASAPGYRRGYTAHVAGTWFSEADFKR